MANLIDYVHWRGDLTFAQDPPNAVDALVFSGLAYVRYGPAAAHMPGDARTLKDAAEEFFAYDNLESRVRVKNDLDLLYDAARSVRFGRCRLCMYRDRLIPEEETQFAAMTFLLDDGSMMLSFRGTDNTLVGWKEDFNMTFQQTIPAQRLAQQYVQQMADFWPAPIRLCGHSKGGNLAVYAGATSAPEVQRRIQEVFNHDGPGFTQYMMEEPGYLAMVPRVKTYVPQSSVIGMLLEHEETFTVIRSNSVGILQHDLYSWELLGNQFLTVGDVTAGSHFLDATIKTWFSEMTNQERNQLVDVMFALLGTGGVGQAADIWQPKNLHAYWKTLNADPQLRRLLTTEFQALLEAAKKAWTQMEQSRTVQDGDRESGRLLAFDRKNRQPTALEEKNEL